MTKEWCETKNKEIQEEYKKAVSKLHDFIINFLDEKNIKLSDKDINYLKNDASMLGVHAYNLFFRSLARKMGVEFDSINICIDKTFYDLVIKVSDLSSSINKNGECYAFDYLLDTEIVEFDGNVLVTDPCYILKEDADADRDEWEYCNYGDSLEKLGITKFVTNRTLYGDWSCTMYNFDTKKAVGEFCVDAGLVSIMDFDQALAYNNEGVKELIEKSWCATVIRNFKGTGQVKVKEIKYMHEGKEHTDYEAYVELIGVNKNTGKDVHYISAQTGL